VHRNQEHHDGRIDHTLLRKRLHGEIDARRLEALTLQKRECPRQPERLTAQLVAGEEENLSPAHLL
jgi:hypothetical protein